MGERIVAEPAVLAAYLHRLYRLDCLPVSIAAVGARAGRLIHIWQTAELPAHGFSAPVQAAGKPWQMMIAAGDSREEQRFTFCHELWHIVTQDERVSAAVLGLDVTESDEQVGSFSLPPPDYAANLLDDWGLLTEDYAEEGLADQFAAAFLLPAPWLHRLWPDYRQQADPICQLAARCAVTPKLAFHRLLQLGLLT